MTPFCNLVTILLAFGCIRSIYGAAFSNVVVQRGPVDYISYNPSALSFAGSQLAQLSAEPIESVVPIPSVSSLVSPCVSPCVIPNGPISGFAQIPATTNAKIVAYKSSIANVPVILPNKDARGYQYAYAVFDEGTGDKKSQIEHSDGSVVQGQYSFIQPDGLRREVVYTADDSKGFNVVVRNISPEPESHREEKSEEKKEIAKPVPPCNEVKNEHLTHSQSPHSHEESLEEIHSELEHMEEKKTEEKSAEASEENSSEKGAEISTEKGNNNSHEETHHVSAVGVPQISNAIISYHDIINCLQTKLKGAQNVVSPLTYVLVPSSRGPC